MFFIFFSGFLKLTDAGALTNQEADGGNLRSLFFFWVVDQLTESQYLVLAEIE
jgi:hypothetical protein